MNEFDDPLADTQPRAGVARRLEAHYAALGPTADEVARIQAQIAQRLDAGAGDARSLPRLAPRTRGTHTRALGLAWAAAVTATLGVGLAVAALGGLSGASWFGKVRAMLPWQPVPVRAAFVPFVGFRDLSHPERFGVLDQPVTLAMTDGKRASVVQAWHEADRLIVAVALEGADGQPFDVAELLSGYEMVLRWTNRDGKSEERRGGLDGYQGGDPPIRQGEAGSVPPDNLIHFAFDDMPRRITEATLNIDLSTQRNGVLRLRRPDGRIRYTPGTEVTFTLKLARLDAERAQRDFHSPRPLPALRDTHQGITVQLLDVTDGPIRTVVRVLVTYDPDNVARGEQPAGEVSNGYSISSDGVSRSHAIGPLLDRVIGSSPWGPAEPELGMYWAPAAWLMDVDRGRRLAAHEEPPCWEPAQTVWMRAAKFTATDGLRVPFQDWEERSFGDDHLWSFGRHDGIYPLIDGTIINYCFDPIVGSGTRVLRIPELRSHGRGFRNDWSLRWTDQRVP